MAELITWMGSSVLGQQQGQQKSRERESRWMKHLQEDPLVRESPLVPEVLVAPGVEKRWWGEGNVVFL